MKKKIIIITAFVFGLWSGIFWQSQPVKAMLSDVSVTPIIENSNVTDNSKLWPNLIAFTGSKCH